MGDWTSDADLDKFEGVKAIRQTEKALLVRIPKIGEKWVPQSVIHDDSEVYKDGDEGRLVVKSWFVLKDGW